MKKINITIPDGLTPQQEVLEIATRLRQNMLAGNGRNKDVKRIGDQVDIQHLKTQITITRKGAKPVEMIKCNVCECEYQSDLFTPVFTNYGGTTRKIKTCSEQCANDMVAMFPGRVALKKRLLKRNWE